MGSSLCFPRADEFDVFQHTIAVHQGRAKRTKLLYQGQLDVMVNNMRTQTTSATDDDLLAWTRQKELVAQQSKYINELSQIHMTATNGRHVADRAVLVRDLATQLKNVTTKHFSPIRSLGAMVREGKRAARINQSITLVNDVTDITLSQLSKGPTDGEDDEGQQELIVDQARADWQQTMLHEAPVVYSPVAYNTDEVSFRAS